MDDDLLTLEDIHRLTGCSYRTIRKRLFRAGVKPVLADRKSAWFQEAAAMRAVTNGAERATRPFPAPARDSHQDDLALAPLTLGVPRYWFGEPVLLAGALRQVLGAELVGAIDPRKLIELQGYLLLLFMEMWNQAAGRELAYEIPKVLLDDCPEDVLQRIERALRGPDGE